jgi:glycosyltransferase involved in cell wall biosynthesis
MTMASAPSAGLAAGDSPRITTVVMAFNEAENLRPTVRELLDVLGSLGQSYELLIINDGSSDTTGEVADDLAQGDAHVRVLHHPANQGLGGVYRSGFTHSRGALVTFFPADGQFPASIIPRFIDAVADVDMVLGYIPNRKGPAVARILSWAERVLYRFLFGPLPRFQGVLMFHRHLLDQVKLKSDGRGWAVLMELIIRCSRDKYRLVSLPTTLRPRLSGASKVNNLNAIRSNLRQVILLRRQL